MSRAHGAKPRGSDIAKVQLNPGSATINISWTGGPLEAAPVPLHRLKSAIVPLRLRVKANLPKGIVEVDSEKVRPWIVAVTRDEDSDPVPQGRRRGTSIGRAMTRFAASGAAMRVA